MSKFAQVVNHYQSIDPKLAQVRSTLDLTDWLEEHHSDDHFVNLTRDIVYQQLSGKAAATIFGRFETLMGKMEPQAVLDLPDQAIRDVGLSWAKVKYVKDLATQTQERTVNLAGLNELEDEEVIEELIKVKGIGRWTAEMFLIFTLHRENIFSYGDLGLRKGFAKLYEVEDPTNEQMAEVVSRWSPYKTYGSLSLWHYLDDQ